MAQNPDRSTVDASHAGDKKEELKKVTPNSVPPKPGESVLVDRSAPADNNVAEIKKNDRKGEGELAPVQPGDPKVRTNEGDKIVERDATTEEIKSVDARKKPEHVTDDPANGTQGELTDEQKRNTISNVDQGDNGQDDEPVEEPTVQLKNPGGRVVTVRVSDVAHQQMFAAGFTTVEGEDYPDEIAQIEDAYKNNLKAVAHYSDVDQSDPQQLMSKGDIARRKGTKKVGDQDGEPQARVAAPKNADKPVSFDGVDQRENGQIVNPKTNKPLKSNRLSQALQQ